MILCGGHLAEGVTPPGFLPGRVDHPSTSSSSPASIRVKSSDNEREEIMPPATDKWRL